MPVWQAEKRFISLPTVLIIRTAHRNVSHFGALQNSYDMERLCVEMINHLRNFLIVKTVKDSPWFDYLHR